MLKKIMLVGLVGLMFNLVCPARVWANPVKEAEFAMYVKTEIAKLGVGKDARIKVKLFDKTKIKGYISEANEENFVVVNDKTGTATSVEYSKVRQVRGKNNLTGTIVAAAIVLTMVVLLVAFTLAKEDG